MPKTSPEETEWLRSRFSCWLRSALSSTSIERLATALYGSAKDGKALGRSTVRALSLGARTPTAKLAWRIGEELQRCDVAWSSGPIALYAAGHDSTVVATLAHLAELGDVAVALDLFAALPLAVEVEIDACMAGSSLQNELMAFDVVNGHELPVFAARSFISNSITRLSSGTLSKAYERANQPKAMWGVKSENAREAYRIAGSSIAPDRSRELAWQLLEDWACEFLDPWDRDGRAAWRAAYVEWRSVTTTALDAARERRRASARELRRTPGERASRDQFLQARKKSRGTSCS